MNQLATEVLAIVGVIIIALALSATKDGARLVHYGIAIAIVVVVLKNSNAIQNTATSLSKVVAATPRQSTSP